MLMLNESMDVEIKMLSIFKQDRFCVSRMVLILGDVIRDFIIEIKHSSKFWLENISAKNKV